MLPNDGEAHMKLLVLHVGKEATIERLLPLYLQLLRDESSEVCFFVLFCVETSSAYAQNNPVRWTGGVTRDSGEAQRH